MKIPRPRYSSNSRIFSNRGDPWVSEREGVKDYGRDLFHENPDFDRYFCERHPEADRAAIARADASLRKGLAELHASNKPKDDAIAPTAITPQRKIATIAARMNRKLKK